METKGFLLGEASVDEPPSPSALKEPADDALKRVKAGNYVLMIFGIGTALEFRSREWTDHVYRQQRRKRPREAAVGPRALWRSHGEASLVRRRS